LFLSATVHPQSYPRTLALRTVAPGGCVLHRCVGLIGTSFTGSRPTPAVPSRSSPQIKHHLASLRTPSLVQPYPPSLGCQTNAFIPTSVASCAAGQYLDPGSLFTAGLYKRRRKQPPPPPPPPPPLLCYSSSMPLVAFLESSRSSATPYSGPKRLSNGRSNFSAGHSGI